MVDQAEVVSADLEASNGVVHMINAVLLPPDIAEALVGGDDMETTTTTEATTTTAAAASDTIADFVAGNEDFSILLSRGGSRRPHRCNRRSRGNTDRVRPLTRPSRLPPDTRNHRRGTAGRTGP